MQLAHVLRHRLRALRIVRDGAGRDAVIAAGNALGDVAHRQKGEPLVALAIRKYVGGVAHLRHDIPMAEHRALGRSGRPRGVNQDGEVIRSARSDHRVPIILAARHAGASLREKCLKRDAHRVGKFRQTFHVEDHDALERRAAATYFQCLVELLVVFDEQHAGA